MRGKTVTWEETGEVFESLRAAAKRFNVSYGTLDRDLKRANGVFGMRPGVTLLLETYVPKEGEVFRPVPGFEGRYSISNLKNVRTEKGNKLLKPTKGGCNNKSSMVMLYTDKIPTGYTVARLFKMAWPELCEDSGTYRAALNPPTITKSVECITDGNKFNSYIDCCKYYRFDYQTFRKAVKTAEDGLFRFRDKEFNLA